MARITVGTIFLLFGSLHGYRAYNILEYIHEIDSASVLIAGICFFSAAGFILLGIDSFLKKKIFVPRVNAASVNIFSAMRHFRWQPFVITAIIFLAIASPFVPQLLSDSDFVSLPIRESDKVDAARKLVAWIVEGRGVPGFTDERLLLNDRSQLKHFFIICEFIPPEVLLSNDPRVQRITEKQYKKVFKKRQFDDTYYVYIMQHSESQNKVDIDYSFLWGPIVSPNKAASVIQSKVDIDFSFISGPLAARGFLF